MTSSREIELKLALPDEEAWHWVRERLTEPRVTPQSNHFFDAPGAPLRAARVGVRLRREDERRLLTVKSDGQNETEGALSRRIELESAVPREAFDEALVDGLLLGPWIDNWRAELAPPSTDDSPELEAFLTRLERLTSEPLQRFGGFDNERTTGTLRLDLPDGPQRIEVELDRTHFPGGRTDFELEVEFPTEGPKETGREVLPEEVQRALIDWLAEGGIHPFEAASKLARFQAILESEATRSTQSN
jgi:hypothetical protein